MLTEDAAWEAYDAAVLKLAALQRDPSSTPNERFLAAVAMRERWAEFDRAFRQACRPMKLVG